MSETVIRLSKEKDELAARCSELEEQNKCLLAEVTELRSCIDRIMPHNEKLKAENQYMREEKAGIEMELQRLAPTVDAVEVVRCKDCRWSREKDHREPTETPKRLICQCFMNHHIPAPWGARLAVNPEHFCSYGGRREGE